MAVAVKQQMLSKVVSFVAWLTGVLVALAVGFGMTDGGLAIRWIPSIVTVSAGWVVIATTIIGVVLAIIDALK
jgi:hypothetical protein